MAVIRTLEGMPPYIFSVLDERRAAARAAGRRLIDLGIGSPDQQIPSLVLDAIREHASRRELSGYPHFAAHPEFAAAVVPYLARRFGVSIDPSRELLALAGSKEGIAEVVLAHCNPGDVVLVPAVHYPVYARATLMAGAVPVYVPFDAQGRLDLAAIAPADLARAKLLIANYPSNPTTATLSLEDWRTLVDFARRHRVLLVSDLAYSELSFDGTRVPSALEVPGAAEVTVEFHSCSKTFNMAGLRIAFVVGQGQAISAIRAYRANIGYGVSTLAQLAGAAAFVHADQVVPPIVDEYRRRRDALAAALQTHGWPVTPPSATMYFWLSVPPGFDDWAWVDALMSGPGVVVTPGIAFGEAGRGRFRVSLVQPAAVLADAARGIVEVAATGLQRA
ncbi:MAG: aminotransferase class I/II-fold pyridoxal phosphate-dependent enzyme [Gemmatimonadaceae bacterium]|nr:aminotransferase class I/II-fold pyridoxal phosphate-dependent enzyme [Gemmatimonadaceae bacterium]